MYPDLALFLLRVVIGGVVIPHGLLKLGGGLLTVLGSVDRSDRVFWPRT